MRANSILFGLHLAQRAFGYSKPVIHKREDGDNSAERSIVQRVLDEVQPIQEFEQMQEAAEAEEAKAAAEAEAQASAAAKAAVAKATQEALVDANGNIRTYAERFPPAPKPHHWTDDIPRDENGTLDPTRKQQAEIDRMVMSTPKKTG